MKLHYRDYPSDRPDGPPVVLLHGLFGSSTNWHDIARQLSAERRVVVPDLRNHGRSPHADEVGYPAMGDDLSGLLDELGLDSVVLVGHSMGGKVAMWTALHEGSRVERLVVVDIAPVAYEHEFEAVLAPLRSLPLAEIENRRDADARLRRDLPAPALRSYLLQNLEPAGKVWRWRLNLDALSDGVDTVAGFPAPGANARYLGETRFLYGGGSNYVRPDHRDRIRSLFPYARLRAIPGAGHWVYAEKPEAFLQAVRAFLA